jgi:hypothetical protein
MILKDHRPQRGSRTLLPWRAGQHDLPNPTVLRVAARGEAAAGDGQVYGG